MIYVEREVLHKFVKEVFEKMGISEEHADMGAEVVVQSDYTGVETHGLARMPLYVSRLKKDLVNKSPNIRQRNTAENLIALDGDNGPGVVVGPTAINMCIEQAKKHGIAAVAINNSNHYGVGNYYAWKFAEANLIGITMTNSSPNVPPFGGKIPLIGTNPITISIPAGERYPIVLDMATSVVAYGRIQRAANANEKIPLGWALDKDGRPTEDPFEALKGSLVSIAGYKGYGLAVIIDILSAVLSQAAFGTDIGDKFDETSLETERIGHFMLAIDVSKFQDVEEFKKTVDQYIDMMKNSEKAEGVEEIFLPGELEFLRSAKIKETGIPIKPATQASVLSMANEVGIISGDATIEDLFNRYK